MTVLTGDQVTELAELFHLLGDQNRLRIVTLCLDEAVSVGEMAQKFELSQTLVSHHLRLLRAARILRAERQGKHVFYSAADDHIRVMLKDMMEHVVETAHDDP